MDLFGENIQNGIFAILSPIFLEDEQFEGILIVLSILIGQSGHILYPQRYLYNLILSYYDSIVTCVNPIEVIVQFTVFLIIVTFIAIFHKLVMTF